jgi:large subunit ribosomal protein L18e
MVKRTGPTSVKLQNLVVLLNKTKVKIWKRTAEDLCRPTRIRRQVNISSINKNLKKGEIALVPGKVLGDGQINKDITVAAWRFSAEAKAKIGKAISIEQLVKENPKGSKVRIIG